jgi:hypothetical protein
MSRALNHRAGAAVTRELTITRAHSQIRQAIAFRNAILVGLRMLDFAHRHLPLRENKCESNIEATNEAQALSIRDSALHPQQYSQLLPDSRDQTELEQWLDFLLMSSCRNQKPFNQFCVWRVRAAAL